jgi:hypothetical protein
MGLGRGENRECDGAGKMEEKKACRVFVGQHEGKKSLELELDARIVLKQI